MKNIHKINQNIYINSSEKIKEGDWFLFANKEVKKADRFSCNSLCKKIILTTDQDLIKDGVQAIDDEFLEWFVKNPSCEVVEVDESPITSDPKGYKSFYKIIIPKEKQEQKTLEEFKKK